jgi:hypothetical protein
VGIRVLRRMMSVICRRGVLVRARTTAQPEVTTQLREFSGQMQEQRCIRALIATLAASLVLSACGPRTLSADEQKLIAELQADRTRLQADITRTESMAGRGLVGALASVRLEALRSTEALLGQRIVAIETGAPIKFEEPVRATRPEPDRAAALLTEIAAQEKKVEEAERRSMHSGGLAGAMASITVETERQGLATLRLQYLSAKYGLPSLGLDMRRNEPISAPVPAGESAGPQVEDSIVTVKLAKKNLTKNGYEDFVRTDLVFTASGLDKPARAIKGILSFRDLFGEQRMALRWTIDDPLAPGQTIATSGSGFEYNQFMNDQQWVVTTATKDIATTYRVTSIIYQDGTRKDFDE